MGGHGLKYGDELEDFVIVDLRFSDYLPRF